MTISEVIIASSAEILEPAEPHSAVEPVPKSAQDVLRANFAEWEAYSAQSVKHYAQFSIQSLLYINGDALVVIMALIGNMFHSPQGDKALEFALQLKPAFDLFVAGMIFCVFSAGATYLNYTKLVTYWRNLRFAEGCDQKRPPNPFSVRGIFWTRFAGILFVIFSGTSFFFGCFESIQALATFHPTASIVHGPG